MSILKYMKESFDMHNFDTSQQRIVTQAMKCDFHIHSVYSRYKDGEKVKNNTIENVGVLIKNLNENSVNMFAITDHDCFSYDMYKSCKLYEGKGSVRKVFPGVEFSVGFLSDDNKTEKQIHVIALFNDNDDTKVRMIENIVGEYSSNGKLNYNNCDNSFFSEDTFLSILKRIGLDVVLIAHQKGSVSSIYPPMENDANVVGDERFNEFLNTEYFDSYEFKKFSNGIFNKLFAKNKNERYEMVRFVTGSDCHNWCDYFKLVQKNDFQYTYLKCLPTFKGVMLALTDYSRISNTDALFAQNMAEFNNVILTCNGAKLEIPISKGINVIIGDNSIGKSLLIHSLTEYTFLDDVKLKKKYEKYLNDNSIKIESAIQRNGIFKFDAQGAIRNYFSQDNEINCFKEYYPNDPSLSKIKETIKLKIDKFIEMIIGKEEYENILFQIRRKYVIGFDEIIADGLIIQPISMINQLDKILLGLNQILISLKEKNSKFEDIDSLKEYIESDDYILLNEIKKEIKQICKKYDDKMKFVQNKKQIVQNLNDAINKTNDMLREYKTEKRNISDNYKKELYNLAINITSLWSIRHSLNRFCFDFDQDQKVPLEKRCYSKYKFVKRTKIRSISKDFFKNLVVDKFTEKVLDINNLTQNDIKEIFYKKNPTESLRNIIQDILFADLKECFAIENVILTTEQDDYDGKSNGANSTMYFDILSKDSSNGIYIIDQPEDDVSQLAISTEVIKYFKAISKSKQILIITHNPQFVVNLDVDNVICLEKCDSSIAFKFGALEYEDKEINILDLVAKHLDGGAETIRKRWKRYDKR